MVYFSVEEEEEEEEEDDDDEKGGAAAYSRPAWGQERTPSLFSKEKGMERASLSNDS